MRRASGLAIGILVGALGAGGAAGCGDDGDGPAADGLCAGKELAPWSRDRRGVGGAATFNEILYAPAAGAGEWIELYNPLAIDLDVSGWRIDGAARFAFADGTRIPARGYLVVDALEGALPDDRGALELWNNTGRLIDAVRYEDRAPWPVAAAGSGASLAKRAAETASEAAELWAASARTGGTPGADNDAAAAGLVVNELGAGGDGFWIELANPTAAPIELGGHAIASSRGGEHVLPAGALAPGALVLVDAAALGFAPAAGDAIFLHGPDRADVRDGVRVEAWPRGRGDDGALRYPDVATPGAPNVFPAPAPIVVSEIHYHGAPVEAGGEVVEPALEWIELHNASDAPVDASGLQLVDAVAYVAPPGTIIAPRGYLVVTNDLAAMTAAYPGVAAVGNFAGRLADGGERIVVRDACGNPVDTVAYADGGAWPAAADGGGSTLELRSALADNAAPEAWAASDESARVAWQTVTIEGVAAPSAVGPDGQWHELLLGLLDAGVVLLDDVSVRVDPAAGGPELVTGGDFESGAGAFRIIGNHRHSEVVIDPDDPGNHVLRLAATGPTEHMHNHLETTLAGGHRITNGRTYRISMRARWVSGSNQLHARLYFNRLARTTVLARPAHPGTPGAPNRAAADNLGPTYRALVHAPAVPPPGGAVEVSVAAADPDGIAAMALWTVTGGAATSVPMTEAGGRWTASVPAGAAGEVAQYWIEGTDLRGATSTFPAAGPASRALWRVDDGRAATSGLHNVRIVMTPEDAAWMFAAPNLMSNDPIPATVIYDEREIFHDVGVRLKSSQRGRPVAARVGFALRFPPAQPFRGIHRSVLIDRSGGIGYGQRELFFFQAMNRAGSLAAQYDDLIQVIPPRLDLVGPAHLQLARFGDLYLDFQFEDGGDGDLLEYELIYYPTTTDDGTPTGRKLPQPDAVVGTGVRDLGDDEEAYRQTFLVKHDRWRDDYRRFIRFVRVFGQTGAAFDAQVADVIDVDAWLHAMAIATLSGAIDNYASGSAHNADFYVRPSDDRVLYLPHDLDFLGSSRGPLVASPDLQKLIAVPARARLYYGHLHDIVTSAFNATYLAPWREQFGRLLPGQDFAAHLAYIADRADWTMNLAPNAVLRAFPRVAFAITTAGAALAVGAPTIVLDGTGWIDVHAVVQAGVGPVALAWPAGSAWRATVAVPCGASTVQLDATDRHGRAVGTASVVVTRTGAGC